MNYFIGKIFYGIVWLILTVIQGFLNWIDVCDVVLTTFFIWVVMQQKYGWNGWWALALGLAVSLILYIIFKHRIGFWVVSITYSLLWAFVFGDLLKGLFFPDMTELWAWILVISITAISLRLHTCVPYRAEALAELAAEEAAKSRR